MDLTHAAAYHGPGWCPRPSTLEQEIAAGDLWAPMRVACDHDVLTDVALHCPAADRLTCAAPDELQHLRRIDHAALRRDIDTLAAAYQDLGVTVHELPNAAPSPAHAYRGANAMYVRDLLWMTKAGAVIPRMASTVRAGEELQSLRLCAGLGIPVAQTIGGAARFEGADAHWLRPDLVAVGVGTRTNLAGAESVAALAASQNARIITIGVPRGIQHLLGILQAVNENVLAARTDLIDPTDLNCLRGEGFTVIDVPEIDEVSAGYAFNFVTLAPGAVLMTSGSDQTARLLGEHGITCAAQVHVPELFRGAGGIACATGILRRIPQHSGKD